MIPLLRRLTDRTAPLMDGLIQAAPIAPPMSNRFSLAAKFFFAASGAAVKGLSPLCTGGGFVGALKLERVAAGGALEAALLTLCRLVTLCVQGPNVVGQFPRCAAASTAKPMAVAVGLIASVAKVMAQGWYFYGVPNGRVANGTLSFLCISRLYTGCSLVRNHYLDRVGLVFCLVTALAAMLVCVRTEASPSTPGVAERRTVRSGLGHAARLTAK